MVILKTFEANIKDHISVKNLSFIDINGNVIKALGSYFMFYNSKSNTMDVCSGIVMLNGDKVYLSCFRNGYIRNITFITPKNESKNITYKLIEND